MEFGHDAVFREEKDFVSFDLFSNGFLYFSRLLLNRISNFTYPHEDLLFLYHMKDDPWHFIRRILATRTVKQTSADKIFSR